MAAAGQIRLTVDTAAWGQLEYRSFRIRTPRQLATPIPNRNGSCLTG